MDESEREELGKTVRDEWIAWAKEQPNPKPSWLVPWNGLSEPDKEVDRRIGVRLFNAGVERVTLLLETSGTPGLDVDIARLAKIDTPDRKSGQRQPRLEDLAQAALAAFRAIGDRSAGSGNAWEALARALGVDTGETTASEMLCLLEDFVKERS